MSEILSGRDTIVVEWQYPDKVDSGEEGYQKTVEYIDTLFEKLGVSALQSANAHPHSYQVREDEQSSMSSAMPEAKAHLCDKYGFAGFGTGEKGVYGHAYLWDQHAEGHEDELPFGTMDVSFPEGLSGQITPEKIIEHTRDYFNPEQITWKSTQYPEQLKNFIDFAPHIIRQRLLIQGLLSDGINQKKVSDCMEKLCDVLKMGQLSAPEVYPNFAFMHWEDSGTVASWTENLFNIDIYTCKGFDDQTAIELIKQKINLGFGNVQSL